MISMKQPLQLLMFTALAFARKNYLDSKIHCVAGDFTEGENAKITCYFHQDLNPEGISINVGHYPSFAFQETGDDILACAFKNGLQGPDCFQRDGYFYDKFTNGTLTLVIPKITKAFEGMYDCRLVSDESIRIPCNLTVTDKLFAKSSLSTADASSNKGLIVGLSVGAVTIVIILIILFLCIRFKNRNKSSSTTEDQQQEKLSAPGTPTSSNRHDSDITGKGSGQSGEEIDADAIITCKSPFLPVSKEPLETQWKESETVVIEMAAAVKIPDDVSDRQTPNEPLNDLADQSSKNQPLDDISNQTSHNEPLDNPLDQPPPYQLQIPDNKQSADLQRLDEKALKLKDYLEQIATELDGDSKLKKQSKIVGGSVALGGAAAMTAGAVAAPFTGGLSLALTTAGVLAAAAGRATTTVATLRCNKLSKEKAKAAQKTLEEFRTHMAAYLQESDKNGTLRNRLISEGFLSPGESEVALPTGTKTKGATARVLSTPVAVLGLIGAAVSIYDIVDGAVDLQRDKKSSAGDSIREIVNTKIDTLIRLIKEEKR